MSYQSKEGLQGRLNILQEIASKIKVETSTAIIGTGGEIKLPQTKAEAAQPQEAVKENEPHIEKAKPKVVAIPHGHGTHYIIHGISAAANATTHALYHERLEKGKKANEADSHLQ